MAGDPVARGSAIILFSIALMVGGALIGLGILAAFIGLVVAALGLIQALQKPEAG